MNFYIGEEFQSTSMCTITPGFPSAQPRGSRSNENDFLSDLELGLQRTPALKRPYAFEQLTPVTDASSDWSPALSGQTSPVVSDHTSSPSKVSDQTALHAEQLIPDIHMEQHPVRARRGVGAMPRQVSGMSEFSHRTLPSLSKAPRRRKHPMIDKAKDLFSSTKLSLLVLLLLAAGLYMLSRRYRDAIAVTPASRLSSEAEIAPKSVPPFVPYVDPQRDTLVLYRILGNDLPPRHQKGQTIRNLQLLLDKEFEFDFVAAGPIKRVEKYFVLNRIVDPISKSSIINVLLTRGIDPSHILDIPFSYDDYKNIPFKWTDDVLDSVPWGIGHHSSIPPDELAKLSSAFKQGSEPTTTKPPDDPSLRRAETFHKLKALDFIYHDKNLYAMNNNGGRNAALTHGRDLPHARWILPMDGNSFFNPAAIQSIVYKLAHDERIRGQDAHKYLVIPMARLLDNEQFLANNTGPSSSESKQTPWCGLSDPKLDAMSSDEEILRSLESHCAAHAPISPEEPQLGFRYNSERMFNPTMRYGRRSKLELLWKLGAIPQERNLDKRILPWEKAADYPITRETWKSVKQNESSTVPDTEPAFIRAGWVSRLFSGDLRQEQPNSESAWLRNIQRIKGTIGFLENLDEHVIRSEELGGGFSRFHLFTMDKDVLDTAKLSAAKSAQQWQFLAKMASVRDSVLKDNLPSPPLQSLSKMILGLSVAAYLTGDERDVLAALKLLSPFLPSSIPINSRDMVDETSEEDDAAVLENDEFLLNNCDSVSSCGFGYSFPLTRPTDSLAHIIRHTRLIKALPFRPVDFVPHHLLDAVRLLQDATASTSTLRHLRARVKRTAAHVEQLAKTHLAALLFSDEARSISRLPADAAQGLQIDLSVAVLAAYLDNALILSRVANLARLRLHTSGARQCGLACYSLFEEMRPAEGLVRGLVNIKLFPYNTLPLQFAGYDGLDADLAKLS